MHFQHLGNKQDKHKNPSLFEAKFMESCLFYYMFSQSKALPSNVCYNVWTFSILLQMTL